MVQGRSKTTRDNLLNAVNDKKQIVLYDVETTGLNSEKDRIIQLSGIKFTINGNQAAEISRFDRYINPKKPIPPKITELTGISDQMVFNQPSETEILAEILEFFGEGNVISGYNVAKFDNHFIENLFKRHGKEFRYEYTVDVLEMARDNVNAKDVENFKLGTMAALYGVDKGLTFHNSMDDVIATQRLLLTFIQQYKDDMKTVQTTANQEQKNITDVHSIRFWEGYKGFSRIYVGTNLGEFYYDTRKHLWATNPKSNPYSIDEIDMESLYSCVMKKSNTSNETEFVQKYTSHKSEFKDITEIYSLRYWEKVADNGKSFHRIYITSDAGNFFYDIDKKKWLSNDGLNVKVDTEKLKTLCFQKAKVKNEEEFALYR